MPARRPLPWWPFPVLVVIAFAFAVAWLAAIFVLVE